MMFIFPKILIKKLINPFYNEIVNIKMQLTKTIIDYLDFNLTLLRWFQRPMIFKTRFLLFRYFWFMAFIINRYFIILS